MAAVVGINSSRLGLRNGMYHRNQPNKSKVAQYICLLFHGLCCFIPFFLVSPKGFTTYHLCSTSEFRGPGYMWKVIENNFPAKLKEAVKGMRMCQDNKVRYMRAVRLYMSTS